MDQDQDMIAWAAGLFEGEGTVPSFKRPRSRIALSMTDEDIVRKFHAVVGMGTVGCTHSPSFAHCKPRWRWEVTRRDRVAEIYEAFGPYLGERRRAAFESQLAQVPTPHERSLKAWETRRREQVRRLEPQEDGADASALVSS